MARTRQPTAIHVLKGTGQVHPERMRARQAEPQPDEGLGDCPEGLAPEVAQAWQSLTEGCAPGVLTSMDRVTMEMAATLLAKFRADPMECEMPVIARLHSLLSSMGMTPADRSKVVVTKGAAPTNPFLTLLGGRSDISRAS